MRLLELISIFSYIVKEQNDKRYVELRIFRNVQLTELYYNKQSKLWLNLHRATVINYNLNLIQLGTNFVC